MKQAKRISPTPILEAIVEIRFEPKIKVSGGSLAIKLGKELDEFPKLDELPAANIPAVIREQDKRLRFQATHRLSNENYNLSVGSNVLSIGFVKSEADYPGWETFNKKVESVLSVFEKTVEVETYNRIGVRFINNFDNDQKFIEGIAVHLTHPFASRLNPNDSSVMGFLIKSDDVTCKVQISTGATVNAGSKDLSIIDLDASKAENVAIEDLRIVIDKCHELAKEVFFSIIEEDYAKTIFKEIEE